MASKREAREQPMKPILRGRRPVTVIEDKTKSCACSGTCSGYGTKNNCPPLIVIAVTLTHKEAAETR